MLLTHTHAHSNWLDFSVVGETGRSYRLMSSTNLIDWSREFAFPIKPFWPSSSSIFYQSNSTVDLTVSNASARKFFRVTPYTPVDTNASACINNLNQIRIAKFLWYRDYNPPATATPTDADLTQYFPHHSLPFCPLDTFQSLDTSYTLGNLATDPTCKISSVKHVLEEAR